MRRAIWVLTIGLFGGCGYERGSYRVSGIGEFPPARATLECLDLGVGLDPAGSPRVPLVRVQLGNSCDHAIAVDLGALRVEGRDDEGSRIALAPVDASWLRPRELGARWFARELVRYEPASGPAYELREVCVDVGRTRVGMTTEHWLCLPVGGRS